MIACHVRGVTETVLFLKGPDEKRGQSAGQKMSQLTVRVIYLLLEIIKAVVCVVANAKLVLTFNCPNA